MKDNMNEKFPLVSVVMAVYNETVDEIRAAINSIEEQNYLNIEFIIVFDNPDNYQLFDYLLNYVKKSSKIILLKNHSNLGLARSLNIGIKKSKGLYIARMDADDVSVPARIRNQINFMRENGHIDILSSECVFINEKNEVISEFSIENYSSKQMKKLIRFQNFLIHPSWLVKRSVYETLNGYRYFASAQDYDFLLRAVSKDFQLGIIHEKLIMYRIRENSISSKSKLKQFITADYIRRLYHERKKSGIDSFSPEKINDILNNITLNDEKLFNKAQERYNHNKLFSMIYIVKSKYFRKYIIQKVSFNIYRGIFRGKNHENF